MRGTVRGCQTQSPAQGKEEDLHVSRVSAFVCSSSRSQSPSSPRPLLWSSPSPQPQSRPLAASSAVLMSSCLVLSAGASALPLSIHAPVPTSSSFHAHFLSGCRGSLRLRQEQPTLLFGCRCGAAASVASWVAPPHTCMCPLGQAHGQTASLGSGPGAGPVLWNLSRPCPLVPASSSPHHVPLTLVLIFWHEIPGGRAGPGVSLCLAVMLRVDFQMVL